MLIWVRPPPGDGSVVLAQSVNGHVTLATIRRVGDEWEFTFERGCRNPGPHRSPSYEWAQRQIKGFLLPRVGRLVGPDELCTYGRPGGSVPYAARGTDALGNPWPAAAVPKRPQRRRYR